MGDTCTQLGHLVYIVDMLAGDVVETVEISLVRGISFSDFDFSAEITVSKIVRSPSCIHWPIEWRSVEKSTAAGRFPCGPCLRFLPKLFPPFSEEVEFRIIVDKNLCLLTGAVQSVAGRCIEFGHVAVGCVAEFYFHFYSTLYELLDIVAGYCDGEKSYRSKH